MIWVLDTIRGDGLCGNNQRTVQMRHETQSIKIESACMKKMYSIITHVCIDQLRDMILKDLSCNGIKSSNLLSRNLRYKYSTLSPDTVVPFNPAETSALSSLRHV